MTRLILTAIGCVLLAACASTQQGTPPRDDYVTGVPRGCPKEDLNVEVLNFGPETIDVFWVVGRKSDRTQGARYRVVRGRPGRTLVVVPPTAGAVILSELPGHWYVAPVQLYGKGYAVQLQCASTSP
jgi:hypothetical protein